MLNGGRATCFAYGQTGAGKTHTMLGSSPGKLGLYALAAQDIFSYISTTRSHSHLTVYISFFEIYCGHLYDLLDHRKRLFAREDGQKMVHIAGLCHIRVDSVNSLLEVISQGTEERTQGMSGVNPLSSRSHALLQIQLRDPNQQTFGRMWFVDLAGSERASDSKEPDKQSRMEGAEINQSLLALKECIRSLDQEQSHTPFRQSKLTQVLKDSFVGDSMTCMIANISPCNSATEHTLNTLRYADRVKELKGLGGHRRGRRGKTTPCPKYNLSNNNSTFGGSSVGTRGKSPPKKPKLQREAFGPSTPTMRLPKGGTFLCSTPRNNRWGEETNVREKNGNVFDEITPIRCSSGSGDKRQRGEGEHKSDTERWRKVDRHSFSDQNTNAGLALRQPKDGQPFLWEVQRKGVADEGNFCLGRRHSGFCNREEEKQQGISTEQGKEMEMKCREQTGQIESIKDTCDEVERMREDLQVNKRKKEREKHLRLYHQQLQQFVPSPVSVSSSNQPSLTSSPSSSSNVSASPLRYDHLEEILDVYRARVEVRAHSNRGLLPFPSEQVCVQTETFPSYNLNNDEEGHRGSVCIDSEWKATEATFRQTEDRSGSERRTPLEVKWEREARVRRPVQIVEGEKWAWVATTQSEQAHRMPGAMMNDVEALMSNNCDSEEIRLGRQEEVDASSDGVWSVEDAEESDGLGSTCSNSDNISVFNHPPAESASQRAPAERPLSPGCEHNNALLTLSSLNHSPRSKQSRCSSKILPLLNTLKGAPSHSCEQKELNLGVNASKREFTSLPLTTSIKHDGCIEPFNTLPENLSYIQIHNRQDSKAKMSVLPQEESFAGFLNDSMDPLSISMLQVDQQAATDSFLQGKESIHSLCPPDMEGGEGDGRGMEKEHFTCEKTRGKVEEDKDIKFHMFLLKKICSSATSADRLGMVKSSIPVSCVAQPTTEPLAITASAPPLKSTRHTSLQTSAIQSNSPSVHYPGSHYVITHSATQMPPQYVPNIHRESASSISATQTGSIQDNSNTMPNQRHSVHSGYARETNKLPQLTSPRQPNNKGEGRTNQQLTSKTNLEDLDEAQWCVVQAHWEQLKEMEALTHKEGTLLCQQPDMTFAEYINQLEVIMERKAKCVHSMIAQLQPYLKFSPSSHQQHKQEDDHNLTI
ncbi:uncharacterized protein LOC115425405 isoform X2 [Sphaeramia orbicularis]|nr:uncharacterized protein LOC115425405 isoform X2 [Sphaeramia orbicularis]